MKTTFRCLAMLCLFLYSTMHAVSVEHVRKYLKKNAVILEAGANDGYHTMIFSDTFPHATIHSFEPLPDYYKIVKKKTRSRKNVKVYPYALNTYTGEATFYRNQANSGSSSLLPAAKGYTLGQADTPITVPCIRLDDWMQRHGVKRIDFMWLDMEGMEYKLLKSYEKVLEDVTCIIIETNYREFRKGMSMHYQNKELLEKYDFVCIHSQGNDGQKDLVWVKRDKLRKQR